jgi:hypothetical protein
MVIFPATNIGKQDVAETRGYIRLNYRSLKARIIKNQLLAGLNLRMNHFRSLLRIIPIMLFVPAFSLCQNNQPQNLRGTLIIEKRPVEFNYLSTPDGTAEIPYFNYLPTKDEYASNLRKKMLPLHVVKNVMITRLAKEESAFVHDSCSGCYLYKARITFIDDPSNTEKTVFLAINHMLWKNTDSGGFNNPRVVELRYLNAIRINE